MSDVEDRLAQRTDPMLFRAHGGIASLDHRNRPKMFFGGLMGIGALLGLGKLLGGRKRGDALPPRKKLMQMPELKPGLPEDEEGIIPMPSPEFGGPVQALLNRAEGGAVGLEPGITSLMGRI